MLKQFYSPKLEELWQECWRSLLPDERAVIGERLAFVSDSPPEGLGRDFAAITVLQPDGKHHVYMNAPELLKRNNDGLTRQTIWHELAHVFCRDVEAVRLKVSSELGVEVQADRISLAWEMRHERLVRRGGG